MNILPFSETLVSMASSLGLLLFLKSSVVLLVGALLVRMQRRESASSRYSIWRLVLVMLLVLPVMVLTLPNWQLSPAPSGVLELPSDTPIVVREGVPDPTAEDVHSAAAGSEVRRGRSPGPVAAQPGEASAIDPVPILAAVFVFLWSAGVIVMVFRMMSAMLAVRRLIRHGEFDPPDRIGTLLDSLRSELGIKRAVRLRLGGAVPLPITWGIFSPVVMLPREARDWPATQLRSVLAHELAHIARWDHLILMMGEVARIFFWLNPLVWWAVRECNKEREWSCDDEVLSHGVDGDQYATHLLAVARTQVSLLTTMGMADRGGLAHRVERALNATLNRSRMDGVGIAILVLLALTVLMPVATFGLRSAGTEDRGLAASDRSSRAVVTVPTTGDLTETLAGNRDPRQRRLAAWWLGEHETTRGVRQLIESLEDESVDVRLAAGWALGEIKDDRAIDPLILSLDDPDPLVREMAVLALGEIENPDAVDALSAIAERLPGLREPVIWALGEIGSRRALARRGALCQDLGRRDRVNQQVWAGDLPLRKTLFGPRAARDLDVPDDLDDLLDDLRSDDPGVRHKAAFGIGLLGARGDLKTLAPVEPLLGLLSDPDPAVRAMAVWSLDEINPSRWSRARG